MSHAFFAFAADERGAISVDWVIMTSVCVGIALGAMALIGASMHGTSSEARGMMAGYQIDERFDTEQEIAALQQAAQRAVAVD